MEIVLPIIILAIVCIVAFFAFRTIGTSQTAETDSADPVPRLSDDASRPLGDTPEAHDEINPHDLPPDHPGRRKAEEMAEGDGETAGMESGGAAGEGGPEEREGRAEPAGEARQGASTTD
jgi:hypothetical protein